MALSKLRLLVNTLTTWRCPGENDSYRKKQPTHRDRQSLRTSVMPFESTEPTTAEVWFRLDFLVKSDDTSASTHFCLRWFHCTTCNWKCSSGQYPFSAPGRSFVPWSLSSIGRLWPLKEFHPAGQPSAGPNTICVSSRYGRICPESSKGGVI